jgi:hypothetical protein
MGKGKKGERVKEMMTGRVGGRVVFGCQVALRSSHLLSALGSQSIIASDCARDRFFYIYTLFEPELSNIYFRS